MCVSAEDAYLTDCPPKTRTPMSHSLISSFTTICPLLPASLLSAAILPNSPFRARRVGVCWWHSPQNSLSTTNKARQRPSPLTLPSCQRAPSLTPARAPWAFLGSPQHARDVCRPGAQKSQVTAYGVRIQATEPCPSLASSPCAMFGQPAGRPGIHVGKGTPAHCLYATPYERHPCPEGRASGTVSIGALTAPRLAQKPVHANTTPSSTLSSLLPSVSPSFPEHPWRIPLRATAGGGPLKTPVPSCRRRRAGMPPCPRASPRTMATGGPLPAGLQRWCWCSRWCWSVAPVSPLVEERRSLGNRHLSNIPCIWRRVARLVPSPPRSLAPSERRSACLFPAPVSRFRSPPYASASWLLCCSVAVPFGLLSVDSFLGVFPSFSSHIPPLRSYSPSPHHGHFLVIAVSEVRPPGGPFGPRRIFSLSPLFMCLPSGAES